MHRSCHSAPARVPAEFNFFGICGAYGYSPNGAIRTIFSLKDGSCGGRGHASERNAAHASRGRTTLIRL
jgi:hypothetical protein